MKRAVAYLSLTLFVGFQADDVVRLCAEWLCSERQDSVCCHELQSGKSGLRVTAKASHCSPEGVADPLEVDRALCCENPSEATNSIFRTAERFPRDAFRQFLLCSAKLSGQPASPAGSGSADSTPQHFLQFPSSPDRLSTVLLI